MVSRRALTTLGAGVALALAAAAGAVAETVDEKLGALLVSAKDEARQAISYMDNLPRGRRPEHQRKIDIHLAQTRAAIWEAQSIFSAQIAQAAQAARTSPDTALAGAEADRADFSNFVARVRGEFVEDTQGWR